MIRGWTNYYRHGASYERFRYADWHLWPMLWRWAVRRHPKKSKKWVKSHYFTKRGNRNWAFRGDALEPGKELTLCFHTETPIRRFVKVQGRRSPLNPDDRQYWLKRKRNRMIEATYSKRRRLLLVQQGGVCPICKVPFNPDQDRDHIDMHHVVPRRIGGSDEPDNLEAVHRWCHQNHHMRNGYRVAEA